MKLLDRIFNKFGYVKLGPIMTHEVIIRESKMDFQEVIVEKTIDKYNLIGTQSEVENKIDWMKRQMKHEILAHIDPMIEVITIDEGRMYYKFKMRLYVGVIS